MGDHGTYGALLARHWSGRHFKTTSLTETFDIDAFREKQPEAVVLFTIREGRLRPVVDSDKPAPGDMLLYQP